MSLILSGDSGLSDVDGSAATPAIRGTDSNTGMFFPAADTIAFAEGGTEVMRIDSSGNVGVGVTPSAWLTSSGVKTLQVGGSSLLGQAIAGSTWLSNNAFLDSAGASKYIYTGVAQRYAQTTEGQHQWFNAASGTAGNAITFTQAMTLDSSGNLLVGKTANNQTGPGILLGRQENGNAPLSDWVKTFSGSIDSIRNWHNGTYVGGVSFSNTATSFPTSSDIRLKTNVVEAPSASAKIEQVRVVSHGWKHDDGLVEFGVIAQELYAVAPQAVTPGDNGEEVERTWAVDYSKLVPMLIKAHQEQQALITSLTARIAALEGAAQ
jgi:hypothetical protein